MSINWNMTRLFIRNYFKVRNFAPEGQHDDAILGYCVVAVAAAAVDAGLQVQHVVYASCSTSHFAAPSPASSHTCMHWCPCPAVNIHRQATIIISLMSTTISTNRVCEWVEFHVSLDTCIIGHFGVESFQEITYTGTNQQKPNTQNKTNTDILSKINRHKKT